MLARAAVLGVFTSIAVAWGLAAWLPHQNLQKQFDSIWPERKDAWAMIWVREYRRPGMARRLWWVSTATGPGLRAVSTFDSRLSSRGHTGRWAWRDWGSLERVVREADPSVASSGADDSRGWPFRAMWCEIVAAPSGPGMRMWDMHGGVVVSGARAVDLADVRVLPLRPIWQGFAADVAVYWAAWLAGMMLVTWGVGAWRRKQGWCVRCGYDLIGTSDRPCPECGWNRSKVAPPQPCALQ